MTDNLPAAPKKSFLSRMFGRKNNGQADDFDHALTLQQARDRISNGEGEKQDLEKYAASLRARYGHKFKSSRFIHPDDGDRGLSSYLYAFTSPVSGAWKINRYEHIPHNGVRTQEIKSGLCFWDALKTVAEYEFAQRSMGKVEAEGELKSEVQASHYKEFATAERIPLDLDGLPLLVYEGEIIGDAMYDEQAVELARMPKPPVPAADDETVQLTAQLAFTKAEMNTDDLKRIIDKESARRIFEEIGKECDQLEGWMEDFQKNLQSKDPSFMRMEGYYVDIHLRSLKDNINQFNDCAELQDIKKSYFDPMAIEIETEAVSAFAKGAFETLLSHRLDEEINQTKQKEGLEMQLSRLEALINTHAKNPAETEEKVRLYIMDRDRDLVMPPSIKKLKEFTDAVSNILAENIKQDNKASVQRGYNAYLSNTFNNATSTVTDTNYKYYLNDNNTKAIDRDKDNKGGMHGGSKMDIIK